jgi:hypothetical protein
MAIKEFGSTSFVYLYHEYTPADSLNPQLAWYTEGWTAGWLSGRSAINIPMPPHSPDIKKIEYLNRFPKQLVLYYFLSSNETTEFVLSKIGKVRPLLVVTERYALFGVRREQVDSDVLACCNCAASFGAVATHDYH